jgi:hypothetical protein
MTWSRLRSRSRSTAPWRGRKVLDDLAEFLKPREERLTFGKVKLVVRELDGGADNSALREAEDRSWRLLVRCVFREDDDSQAFSDADIPVLKRKSPAVTGKLMNAVNSVNGFGLEEEAKNSDAAPG